MLDSERLQSFVVFAETLNFTRAAERRNISQPALFAQVARLTDEVGTALYVREGRRLRLTDVGRQVEAFGRELMARTASLFAEIDGTAATRVTMAAGAGAYLDLLGEGLESFVRRSGAPPKFLVGDGPQVVDLVSRGVATAGVVADQSNVDGLRMRTLATIPMAIVLPRGHPLAARRRVAAKHLVDVPLVVPPAERPLRRKIDELLRRERITPFVAVEASGWPLTLEFARMGLGVAIVNGNVRVPSGLVARPFVGLASVSYVVVERPGGTFGESARLVASLFEHRRAWRNRARTAWALSRSTDM